MLKDQYGAVAHTGNFPGQISSLYPVEPVLGPEIIRVPASGMAVRSRTRTEFPQVRTLPVGHILPVAVPVAEEYIVKLVHETTDLIPFVGEIYVGMVITFVGPAGTQDRCG